VRTVFAGAAPAGRTAAAWDGRDGDGRAVPAGAYFSRLVFGGEERIGKVVRLR
jgi:flagellar hook assembly protein FlgD